VACRSGKRWVNYSLTTVHPYGGVHGLGYASPLGFVGAQTAYLVRVESQKFVGDGATVLT
jgi:hypothetical protein